MGPAGDAEDDAGHGGALLADSAEGKPARAATPVTVLIGALGAGKTTLLKYILEKPHGYRIAVIQNEFSDEMGIEGPLITDANGDTFKDIVELPNGCLCCSAKDGLVSALDQLLEERQRFEYVLVEATGIADPEAICEIFWVDEELGSRVYLDGVITLVDCRNVLSSIGDGNAAVGGDAGGLGLEAESTKQIACADVVVLNKVDLVPEASALARIRQRVVAMNPTASLIESTRAVVDLAAVLGLKAFDRVRLAASLAALEEQPQRDGVKPQGRSECCDESCQHDGVGHCHEHGHGHSHEPSGSGHDGHIVAPSHGIESFVLRGDAPSALYDPAKVEAWLAEVLWEGRAGGIYRCKGLFRGKDVDASSAGAYAVQGVGKIFEVEEVPATTRVEQSKLLFIGRGLLRQPLDEGWRRCLIGCGEGNAQ